MDLEKFLEKINFKKQLNRLNNKLKDKTIVIYGSGTLFQTICQNYDLSKLNIIAVSDGKYLEEDKGKEVCGYKVVTLDDIVNLKPDVILVSILNYTEIIYDFKNTVFKNSQIKIIPFAQKDFFSILKEIWLD